MAARPPAAWTPIPPAQEEPAHQFPPLPPPAFPPLPPPGGAAKALPWPADTPTLRLLLPSRLAATATLFDGVETEDIEADMRDIMARSFSPSAGGVTQVVVRGPAKEEVSKTIHAILRSLVDDFTGGRLEPETDEELELAFLCPSSISEALGRHYGDELKALMRENHGAMIVKDAVVRTGNSSQTLLFCAGFIEAWWDDLPWLCNLMLEENGKFDAAAVEESTDGAKNAAEQQLDRRAAPLPPLAAAAAAPMQPAASSYAPAADGKAPWLAPAAPWSTPETQASERRAAQELERKKWEKEKRKDRDRDKEKQDAEMQRKKEEAEREKEERHGKKAHRRREDARPVDMAIEHLSGRGGQVNGDRDRDRRHQTRGANTPAGAPPRGGQQPGAASGYPPTGYSQAPPASWLGPGGAAPYGSASQQHPGWHHGHAAGPYGAPPASHSTSGAPAHWRQPQPLQAHPAHGAGGPYAAPPPVHADVSHPAPPDSAPAAAGHVKDTEERSWDLYNWLKSLDSGLTIYHSALEENFEAVEDLEVIERDPDGNIPAACFFKDLNVVNRDHQDIFRRYFTERLEAKQRG